MYTTGWPAGLNQHTPSLAKVLAAQLPAAAAHASQHACGVAAGGCGIARHSASPGQTSRLASSVQLPPPPPAASAAAAARSAPASSFPAPPTARASPCGAVGVSPSGDPLGREVRRSTPLSQPLEGDVGQGGRDASSAATVVITKEA
jgi:hypothetical protein